MARRRVTTATVQLHAAQAAFRHSDAAYRGFVGGIGSGKSYAGAYDLLRRALPGRLYMATAPTYTMLEDSSLRSFLGLANHLHFLRDLNRSRMIATLGNGAEVLFRSTDDPERLRGPNLSGAWMDEASLCAREAYEILIGRLREAGQQGWLSATFTPKGRQHWTFDVFGRDPHPGTELFRARTRDNPFLPGGFSERLAGQYTTQHGMQELGGEFIDLAGALFARHWFGIEEASPVGLALVRRWDLASTEAKPGRDPDWTAGVKMGRDRAGRYHVLDVRRIQATPGSVEQLVRHTAEMDGYEVPVRMEQEPGSSGVALCDHYLRHVLPGWDYRGVRSTGDKADRARPLAAQAEGGNVLLLRGPWNKDYLDEMESFPGGGHDDQVDASSGALLDLQGLATLDGGSIGTSAAARANRDRSPLSSMPRDVFGR